MTVVDTWDDWKTDPTLDVPPSTATPEIDKELRNIKAQVKAHVAPSLYAADYAGLTTLLTSIGSTEAEIAIDSAIAVSANLTIPANVTTRIVRGGSFAVATAKTLTVNGPVNAGPYQIFSWTGTGAIDLSGSPTKDWYLENWGAVAGISNDCTAKILKASTSGISGKTLWISEGLWRITSTVQFTQTQGFTLQGTDPVKSIIYADCGASASALVVGVSGTVDVPGTDATVYNYQLKDFMVVGEASSCLNGIQLSRVIFGKFDNVNVIAGCAGYAIVHAGTEHCEANWRIAEESGYVYTTLGINYGKTAGGLRCCPDGFTWGMSTWNRIRVAISGSDLGTNAHGVRMETVGANIILTGDIENIKGSGIALYATNSHDVTIDNLHIENVQENTILLDTCLRFTINDLEAGSNSTDTGSYAFTTTLRSCQNVLFRGGRCAVLKIEPSCSGTILDGVGISESNGLYDYAGDTLVRNLYYDYSYAPMASMGISGSRRDNLLTNTSMQRWTTTYPIDWGVDANFTWTHCGVGESDTTKHVAPDCGLVTTVNATADPLYTLSASQLQMVLGQKITFASWLNLTAAQTWAGSAALMKIDVTVPAWGSGYKEVGVACLGSDGYVWVVTTAGTTGVSEPTWTSTPHQGTKTTDGTVIWTQQNISLTSVPGNYIRTADSTGRWFKRAISTYVPKNATVVALGFYLYQQTGPANATMYVAEPTLHIGSDSSRGYQPAYNEFPNHIQIGVNRMTWGALIPTDGSSPLSGQWAQEGDINWNTGAAAGGSPGWICTTSGVNGSGAVWKAMGNVGA